MSPGKTVVKQGKFVKFISQAKVIFRETFISNNINPISPTPKFTLGIIQIKVKSLSTSFQCFFQYNELICTILISDFSLTLRSEVCVMSKCLLLC